MIADAEEALAWLDGNGAVRVVAHTHVANEQLIRLATSWGFQIVERLASPWPHVTLHRSAAGHTLAQLE